MMPGSRGTDLSGVGEVCTPSVSEGGGGSVPQSPLHVLPPRLSDVAW